MLRFYTVDSNYINYLKQIDKKIPNLVYAPREKFVCGVVLEINGVYFYAPISHFNKAQRTNFPIIDNDKIISTVRLCFMFPAPASVLTQMNFNSIRTIDPQYANLLSTEYRYLKDNFTDLKKKAMSVYKIWTNKSHHFNHTCCDFTKLENNYFKYDKNIDYSKVKITIQQ